jgi:hypothetical protein
MAGILVVRSVDPFKSNLPRPSRRETMPKTPHRDKQRVRPGSPPRTVGDLISARLPTLVQRARKDQEASEWQVAVMNALGPDLAVKVNRCTLESGRLTVVAESSAWAARIRFALADLEPTLRSLVPDFRELQVRVRPGAGARPKR